MALKNLFSSEQAAYERAMSATKVGVCCSKLFQRRDLQYLFTMHSTGAQEIGITEPKGRGSPPGSCTSEPH